VDGYYQKQGEESHLYPIAYTQAGKSSVTVLTRRHGTHEAAVVKYLKKLLVNYSQTLQTDGKVGGETVSDMTRPRNSRETY